MRIRNAEIADLAAIAEVEALCFPVAEAATRDEFRRRLSSYAKHFWLLFEEEPTGERLVSFVDGMVTDEADLTDEMYEHAELHNPNGNWQMIFGVNTIPEYRRKGYAGLLIERAVSDARRQGRKGVVLTCKEALIHYYEKSC